MSAEGEADIAGAIVALELALLQPETRRDRDFLDRHIADDFEEIAASGRRFGKDEVLARLPLENDIHFETTGLQCRWIRADIALLNYDARRVAGADDVRSRRTSLWRLEQGVWRMCFHQGTLLTAE